MTFIWYVYFLNIENFFDIQRVVRDQNMWYDSNFVDVSQIYHWIYENCVIQSWGADGGALWMCNSFWRWNPNFTMKIWLCHEISHTWCPPPAPSHYIIQFSQFQCYIWLTLKKLHSYHIFWRQTNLLNVIPKNHRFLELWQDFGISHTGSRC